MNILDKNFIVRAKNRFPEFFKEKKILEIGSLDVNGNLWDSFDDCQMTGVDWVAGQNVTVVTKAHETQFDNDSFDVLMSVNHLEHDPIWEESLGHNLPSLKTGGLILLRWAGMGSGRHGPEFDPNGKNGYYPKSLEDLIVFLRENNIEIIESYNDHNPYIGRMCNIIAIKK